MSSILLQYCSSHCLIAELDPESCFETSIVSTFLSAIENYTTSSPMLFSKHGAVASATLTSSILARSTRPVILDAACARLRTTQPPSTISVRHASHGTAGRANGPKNGAGKRLGAKKTGGTYRRLTTSTKRCPSNILKFYLTRSNTDTN